MKFKTIKRTYFSKKLGKNVTKEYTYAFTQSNKYRKGDKVLLTPSGNLTNAYQKYHKELEDRYGKHSAEVYDLEAQIFDAKLKHKGYSESTFESHVLDTARERYFYNMGGDIEQVSEDMGISVEDLKDDKNWQGDLFTYNDITYLFSFDYDFGGVTWRRI